MIKTFIGLFKQKEIRRKILFTLGLLFIYRLGAGIPVPLVDITKLTSTVSDNAIFGMMNLLGGGALQKFSIFAMGVGPYITASIIVQLLSMDVIPALTEMTKSGANGKKQLEKVTRYLTVVLALFQAFTLTYAFQVNYGILVIDSLSVMFYITVVLSAGTMFLMWIGDRISMFGIGNGISILIFAGIVSHIPFDFYSIFNTLVDQTSGNAVMFAGIFNFAIYVLMYFVIIVMVIFTSTAIRKIPIQYTSSNLRKQKQDVTYLPLKINSASVIPVIFASAVMTAPQTALSFFQSNTTVASVYTWLNTTLSFQTPTGLAIYGVLVIAFTFFYTNLQVDTEKIADDLGKQGTYIPGIRPGNETKVYLHKVLNRITVLGAAFLVFIAVLPYALPMLVTALPNTVGIGGTGIIIVVGVALETMKDLEGQLTQKTYKGFFG
ncbi:MAG: preprotein translocase subunit SecY [Erysipelotrichaceae bacterium]|nr:preprotein translocase subunit SecY [Erysipelotrichaceae bacterium]